MKGEKERRVKQTVDIVLIVVVVVETEELLDRYARTGVKKDERY